MLDTRPTTAAELAMRVPSTDALFAELDARPVVERELREEVHDHLLDEWERVRDAPASALTVVLPASERDVRFRRV